MNIALRLALGVALCLALCQARHTLAAEKSDPSLLDLLVGTWTKMLTVRVSGKSSERQVELIIRKEPVRLSGGGTDFTRFDHTVFIQGDGVPFGLQKELARGVFTLIKPRTDDKEKPPERNVQLVAHPDVDNFTLRLKILDDSRLLITSGLVDSDDGRSKIDLSGEYRKAKPAKKKK